MPPQTRTPIVVLVSGRGSNLQAIIDAAQQDLPVTIAAVISNDAKAFALERARRAELPTHIIDHRAFPTRTDFEAALRTRIDQHKPALVVLAGFMRLLSGAFVNHYQGRMINVHPSLLPQFRGLNTHQRALAGGCQEHGASVHFVTEEVDAGPIIVQARVPVLPSDTPEALADRVLQQEHLIFPQAIRWFVQGRLTLRGNEVLLDGEPVLKGRRN